MFIEDLEEMKDWRPTWIEYFMSMACLLAKRSSCDRLHVGCVIVNDNRIVATGYNGHLSGTSHESFMRDGHEMMTIHAETNAIADSAKRGVSTMGCTAYVTHCPCINCIKVLLSAGIKKVIFANHYHDDPLVGKLCKLANVELCIYEDGALTNIE